MNVRALLLIAILFGSLPCQSQPNGTAADAAASALAIWRADPASALTHMDQALAFPELEASDSLEYLLNAATIAFHGEYFEPTLKYLRQAQSILDVRDSLRRENLLSLAIRWVQYYSLVGQWERSRDVGMETIREVGTFSDLTSTDTFYVSFIYHWMATAYSNAGLTHRAIENYENERLLLESLGNDLDAAHAGSRIGKLQIKLGQAAKAEVYLQHAISVTEGYFKQEKNKKWASRLASYWHQLATIYCEQQLFDLANTALDAAEQYVAIAPDQKENHLWYRAGLLKETGQYRQGLSLIQQTELRTDPKELLNKSSSGVARFIILESELLRLLGQEDNAIKLLRQLSERLKALDATIDQEGMSDIRSVFFLNIQVELAKNHLALFTKSKYPSDLAKAGQFCNTAKALLTGLQSSLVDEADRLELNRWGLGLYSLGLDITNNQPRDKSQVETALEYMEAGKAIRLNRAVNQLSRGHYSDMPDSLLTQELSFRTQIRDCQNTLAGNLTPSERLTFQSKLILLTEAQQALVQEMEQWHPQYFQAHYYRQLPDRKDLLKLLPDKKSAWLMYTITPDKLFILVISNQVERFLALPHDGRLDNQVDQVRKLLKETVGMSMDDQRVGKLRSHSRDLYRLLIEPVEDILPEQVLIVPDGVLAYLPFDLLLADDYQANSSWQNLPFAGFRFVFSMHPSAQSLVQIDQMHLPPAQLPYIGFAPDFIYSEPVVDRSKLGRLRYNHAEVEAGARIWSGQSYFGKEATKSKFIQEAGRSSILHLATHAKANDEFGGQSFIAFQSEIADREADSLFVKDFGDIRIQSDLLILSACETGIGEHQEGEGILGLTTAFMMAGARSILQSLWAVDDAAMGILTTGYLQELKEGYSKGVALQLAKKDFVQNYPGYSHPYFWAGVIQQGHLEPLHKRNGPLIVFLLLIFCGVLAVLFLRNRRRKSRV